MSLLPVNVGESSSEFFYSDEPKSKNAFFVLKKEQSPREFSESSGDQEHQEQFFPDLSDESDGTESGGDSDSEEPERGTDDKSLETQDETDETDTQEETDSQAPIDPGNGLTSKKGRNAKRNRPVDLLYRRLPENNWECRFCEFRTDVYSRMRYHSKQAHSASGDETVVCKICSKQLSSRRSLWNHMKTHGQGSDSKPFRCDSCSISFRLKHHLKRHESIHRNVGPKKIVNKPKLEPDEKLNIAYVCSICEKKFTTKQSRSRHVKTVHVVKTTEDEKKTDQSKADESPIPCPHCQKMIKNTASLKLHIGKMHWNLKEEAKHVCDFCEKRFVTKPELRYHTMRHLNEFPFHCQKCNFGYPTLSELRKHQNRSKKCNAVNVEGDKSKNDGQSEAV